MAHQDVEVVEDEPIHEANDTSNSDRWISLLEPANSDRPISTHSLTYVLGSIWGSLFRMDNITAGHPHIVTLHLHYT
jgi:hypothetical protein